MESSEASKVVSTVVDKLADKIGIAADKITPVANTVIDEIARRGFGLGIMYGILAILIVVCFIIVYYICRKSVIAKNNGCWTYNEDPTVPLIVMILLSIVTVISLSISVGSCIGYFAEGLAPTLTLVKILMGTP
jgi:hypothetical protein